MNRNRNKGPCPLRSLRARWGKKGDGLPTRAEQLEQQLTQLTTRRRPWR